MSVIMNDREIRMRRQYDLSDEVEAFFLNHDVETLTGMGAKLGLHAVNETTITVYVYCDYYNSIYYKAELFGFLER